MAYKIGNYEFHTQKEYDEARKELNLVKQIRDKYDISDPKTAKQLLLTIERGDKIKLKTSIGKSFIELLRKNAKSQVVKSTNTTVPVRREQTVNSRNTGTRSSWQTDNSYRNERARSTWQSDTEEIRRDFETRGNESQKTETKKIKVKKKNWKVYHTKRNALLYFLIGMGGMFFNAAYMSMADLNSQNMMSDPISAISFWIYSIGATGLVVTLWFGLLRIVYKQASAKRLWGITGYILIIICIIALCCTGVGAIPVILAWSIIRKAIMGMLPTDDDRGLMEVEIEVPVVSRPKARKMFEKFEVTGFKDIPYEEYKEYVNANKEERVNII